MYTVFHIYFGNIQYYFMEFTMVQKLKYTNKVGVTPWQFLDKIKTGQQYRKSYHLTWSYKIYIFRLHLKQRYPF